eukprot:523991-Prymnesium_polylepis.1
MAGLLGSVRKAAAAAAATGMDAARVATSVATETAKASTQLAREGLTIALDTATLEYDEQGRAIVSLDEATALREHLQTEQARNE